VCPASIDYLDLPLLTGGERSPNGSHPSLEGLGHSAGELFPNPQGQVPMLVQTRTVAWIVSMVMVPGANAPASQ